MNKKQLISMLACMTSLTSYAAPFEFDTPNTHVIVIRPVDSWSADSDSSENIADLVQNKKYAYGYMDSNNKGFSGTPAVFSGIGDDPVVKATFAELEKNKVTYAHKTRDSVLINKPVLFTSDEFSSFINAQNNLYKRTVIAQGNPNKLAANVSGKKFLGSVAAVAVTALTLGKFGLQTADATLQSGLLNDVYHLAADQRADLAHVIPMEPHDFSGYAQIEVRKVTTAYKDIVGQIIVAYKTPKTQELEVEAMVPAIIASSGVQESIDEVNKARAEDFALRQAIWDDCVAQSNCK